MSLALLNAFLYKKAIEREFISTYYGETSEATCNVKYKFGSDDRICRVCCQKGDIPIFDKVAGQMISDDIRKCTGVSVCPDDGLPRFLCESCHNLLTSAVKFRIMCLQTEANLRILRVQQSEVPMPPSSKVEVVWGLDSSEYDDAPSPTAPSPAAISAPQSGNLPNCSVCLQDFQNISDYRNHLPECNRNAAISLKLTKKRFFLCEICGTTLTQYCSYLAHKSTHSNKFPFKCDQCPYRAKKKDLLRTHLRSHLTVKPFACELCSFTCTTSSNLRRHRSRHEPQEPQQCPQCDKTLCSKWQVMRHIADMHAGSKPVHCDVCSKQFLHRKGLIKHRLKQHKLKTARGGRLPAYLLLQRQDPGAAPPRALHSTPACVEQ